jgi:hypothetical protein
MIEKPLGITVSITRECKSKTVWKMILLGISCVLRENKVAYKHHKFVTFEAHLPIWSRISLVLGIIIDDLSQVMS